MRWRFRHALGVLVAAGIVAAVVFGFWFNGLLSRPVAAARPTTISIEKGDGVKEVADTLYTAGYLRARWHWNFYIVMAGLRSSILTGQYSLDSGMSLRDIARLVTTPQETDTEATVKLLEGWTRQEIATALERAGVITSADFLKASAATDSRDVVTDKAYGFFVDKPVTADMEGFLFPDTYRFFKHSTAAQVLGKFLDNFESRLTGDMRTKIYASGRTIYDVVILASILEGELRTESDRALAADLFLRRIDAGIALQSDATVNYITGKNHVQASITDTEIDSPYNTYRHRGLPPGPIGNPGLSSLRAAINPEPNSFLYFLTDKSGKAHFAKTYEEHLQNKARYLP